MEYILIPLYWTKTRRFTLNEVLKVYTLTVNLKISILSWCLKFCLLTQKTLLCLHHRGLFSPGTIAKSAYEAAEICCMEQTYQPYPYKCTSVCSCISIKCPLEVACSVLWTQHCHRMSSDVCLCLTIIIYKIPLLKMQKYAKKMKTTSCAQGGPSQLDCLRTHACYIFISQCYSTAFILIDFHRSTSWTRTNW